MAGYGDIIREGSPVTMAVAKQIPVLPVAWCAWDSPGPGGLFPIEKVKSSESKRERVESSISVQPLLESSPGWIGFLT